MMHEITELSPQVRSAVRDQIYCMLAHCVSNGNRGPILVKQIFLVTADRLVDKHIIERPDFLGGKGAGGQRFAQFVAGQQPTVFPDYGIPSNIAKLMRQTIWELYLQGVLMPAPRKAPRIDMPIPHQPEELWMSLDAVFLTPYGVDLLLDSEKRIRVYDPDGYLANFWSANPSPDPEMMRYLSECISVFRGNHLLASVVLLGVASERLIEVLAESLKDALGAPEGTSWYSRYRNRDISKKFSSISNKLREEFGELDLNTDAFQAVEQTFQYIRLARNDIAHPKNRHFTSSEVSGFIHNFVQYFKYINDVIASLANKPKTS